MAQAISCRSVSAAGLSALNSLSENVSGLKPPVVHFAQHKRADRIRAELKSENNTQKASATFGMIAGLVAAPAPALAIEADQVVDAVEKVEKFASQAVDVASQAYETVKTFADNVVDVTSPFFEAAAPVVQDATNAAIKAATPIASDVAAQASKALSDSGVEISPVLEAAKSAASVAGDVTGKTVDIVSPYASSTYENVLAQDPTFLAVAAGALVAAYLITPSLFGGIAYAARGYAGEFTPAQALDLLTKEDYTLIDIRTDAQKAKSGIPSLPRNSRKKLVAVPVDEVSSKLKGSIRNVRKVEAELTAIKIGALKRLGKGSKIILIDAYGDVAKLVAQSLANAGFKNTWVIKDGVDGGNGWIQSQLATESGGSSFAEVLSPSRVISGTFGGKKSGTVRVPRRNYLLPSGSD